MPLPWVAPARRDHLGGSVDKFEDELRDLWNGGIRSVLCLLNMPGEKILYESAGFAFHCVPIANGGIPQTKKDVESIIRFVENSPPAVAVHCEAGLGRTGTVIAMILIAQGTSPEDAIDLVRKAQPHAIETKTQLEFLLNYRNELQ